MSFAAKHRTDHDDKTKCIDLPSEDRSCSAPMEHLIIIRQKRKLLGIYRPREKNITLGRSSACRIRLSDPRFPRKAGELILGPIPILRKHKNDEKGADLITLTPGKTYKIKPYKITLMEPGDVFFNRQGKVRPGIPWMPVLLMLLILAAAGRVILSVKNTVGAITDSKQNEVTLLEGNKSVRSENVKSQQQRKIDRGTIEYTLLPPDPLPVEKSTIEKHEPVIKKPNKEEKLGRGIVRSSNNERKRKQTAVSAERLNRMINNAIYLIEQENLNMAGRALKPMLPLVEKHQRTSIVLALEPLLEPLYERAYMLNSYEPEKANEILLKIIDSEMDFLPTVRKAEDMLRRNNPANTAAGGFQ